MHVLSRDLSSHGRLTHHHHVGLGLDNLAVVTLIHCGLVHAHMANMSVFDAGKRHATSIVSVGIHTLISGVSVLTRVAVAANAATADSLSIAMKVLVSAHAVLLGHVGIASTWASALTIWLECRRLVHGRLVEVISCDVLTVVVH